MAEVLHTTNVAENNGTDILERFQRSSSEMSDISADNSGDNLQETVDSEADAPKKRVKRRIRQFSDSDSDEKTQEDENVKSSSGKKTKVPQGSDNNSDETVLESVDKSPHQKVSEENSSDSDSSKPRNTGKGKSSKGKIKLPYVSDDDSDDTTILKSIPLKSRIQKMSNESSSDSDQALKNEQQQLRVRNKNNKIKDKFKSLITSRGKDTSAIVESELNKSSNSSEDSDNDVTGSSIEQIKQKIKERMSFKPSICDPDTSDEETENQQKSLPKQKKERRIRLTSPKPQRMSSKQAMENMKKIKSESNRMLREKEVSLPYHRPKALSLKDIMSRRKPNVSSDGKSFKIKMNGEQLKQYAQMLEDRQKQMMELWQSDTDEENEDMKSGDEVPSVKTVDENLQDKTDTCASIDEPQESEVASTDIKEKENADVSTDNDKLFDDLSQSIIEYSRTNEPGDNEINQVESINDLDAPVPENVPEEQDSETHMKLVLDDSETSIEDKVNADADIAKERTTIENIEVSEENNDQQDLEMMKPNTEADSQLISLRYDTEKLDNDIQTLQTEDVHSKETVDESAGKENENIGADIEAMDADFSDDDMNIEDIDNIIENADIIRDIEDKVNSQVLIRDRPLNLKPKLAGAPGMMIDLDDSDNAPKKSGVELLKERFTFFAKLKTPEELEREKERKIKPGNQHLKLKQALEEQMAEQRSLEWAKRLEDEKQQQKELKELRGEESDDENDIDKLEAKLEDEENDTKAEDVSENEEEEEELLENDVEMNDKPRKNNPMLENEAEESDCGENDANGDEIDQNEDDEGENDAENGEQNDGDGDDDEDEYSDSDSESEEQPTTKKGRILKAFEDSDDEDMTEVAGEQEASDKSGSLELLGSQPISQDDVLTLAQRHKSVSEDLFSQGSSILASQKAKSQIASELVEHDLDLGTQTFSILDSTNNVTTDLLNSSDKLGDICETQPYNYNLDTVAGISGSFSQSLPPLPITQFSQSQPIGEDILALCTGKFYDSEFVSQIEDYKEDQMPLGASQEYDSCDDESQTDKGEQTQKTKQDGEGPETKKTDETGSDKDESIINCKVIDNDVNKESNEQQSKKIVDDNLKSILDELDDPEFDTPRQNKFFCGAKIQKNTEDIQKETEAEIQIKKKFIIDSDDDTNDANANETKKRKKLKKRKPEKRALQISDDEEEMSEHEEIEEYESEIEEESTERLVEYDSEENEIEIKPQDQKPSKKKHKGNEFFEQEAELTSEDEWAGSGDEDEAGLDRMEREAGDDEIFHQGRLQRELGQIHMRDVLDQDKREVRIIQELLFEDGDLGSGGRQRKFKWKNLDGEEEAGVADELCDTQEEEFESEEQWRKQRHERETFLRQMQNNGEQEDSLNVSINRTTIIKANLMSKTMSMLLEENQSVSENTERVDSMVVEKKAAIIQSPKKPFSLLQQSYQGSILNRGKGALARLAALATPLAVDDDDAPKGKSAAAGSRRNFVFATLTPEVPKVIKRKAEVDPSTPKLVKKMKTEETHNISKNSLLDRMKL